MIGTAFYALGVIACMILIVVVAIIFFAASAWLFRLLAPLLFLAGLVALVWWLHHAEIIRFWGPGDWLVLLGLGIIALTVYVFTLVIEPSMTNKRERAQREAYAQQEERWSVLDRSWNGEAEHISTKETSVREALEWWRAQAESGNPNAQWRLGWLYEHGELVPRDYVQSYKWRELAMHGLAPNSRQHNETREEWSVANTALATKMTPEQIAEGKRLATEWLQLHRAVVQ